MTERTTPVRVLVDGVWLYQHACQAPDCPVTFTSRYPNARTHTDRCRKALSRARQDVHKKS
jgi:hypothetical protein